MTACSTIPEVREVAGIIGAMMSHPDDDHGIRPCFASYSAIIQDKPPMIAGIKTIDGAKAGQSRNKIS
jgi:hypothetical protein